VKRCSRQKGHAGGRAIAAADALRYAREGVMRNRATTHLGIIVAVMVVLLRCPLAPAADARDGRVNVTPYSSIGSGTPEDPWVDALRNAMAAKGGGHTYYLPAGYYKDTRTLLIQDNNVRIEGDDGVGASVTTVLYDETDGSTCWKFAPRPDPNRKRNCLGGLWVQGIAFRGGGKPTGTAIEIEAVRRGIFEDIAIWRWDGDKKNFSNKGIWIKGWDALTFKQLTVYRVPKCIYIDKNPEFATIDADHFHFQDISLVCGNRDVGVGIEIVAPYVTNLIIDGTNSICHSLKGIYFHNKGTNGVSRNISLNNIRVETGGRPDSWGVYVDADQTINFVANNVMIASGFNGFYLRGMQNITLMNCYVMGGTVYQETGYVAYDIDAGGDSPVVLINAGYSKAPSQGYRKKSTLKIADKLLFSAGDALQIYQDGASVRE